MLSGQIPPTSGTAKVLGIDVVADPISVKAAIGIVLELDPLIQRKFKAWLLDFVKGGERALSVVYRD